MADLKTQVCDNKSCNAIKRQSNHWYCVLTIEGGGAIISAEHRGTWLTSNLKDACSLECAFKLLGATLDRR